METLGLARKIQNADPKLLVWAQETLNEVRAANSEVTSPKADNTADDSR